MNSVPQCETIIFIVDIFPKESLEKQIEARAIFQFMREDEISNGIPIFIFNKLDQHHDLMLTFELTNATHSDRRSKNSDPLILLQSWRFERSLLFPNYMYDRAECQTTYTRDRPFVFEQ